MLVANDLNTHLYNEQVTVISRNDATIITSAIAAAIAESKSYLSRYDVDIIFGKEDDERDPILLMWLKDIATWHFITLANADADMEFRQSRYKDAVAWLKSVQTGKVVPNGWPLVENESLQNIFHVTSDPKRITNF